MCSVQCATMPGDGDPYTFFVKNDLPLMKSACWCVRACVWARVRVITHAFVVFLQASQNSSQMKGKRKYTTTAVLRAERDEEERK